MSDLAASEIDSLARVRASAWYADLIAERDRLKALNAELVEALEGAVFWLDNAPGCSFDTVPWKRLLERAKNA